MLQNQRSAGLFWAAITLTASAETRPDLSLTAADLSHPPAAVASPGWLAAEVRNVVADVEALVSFYDGDPANGGRLIGEAGFVADANSVVTVGIDWIPTRAGMRDIYVVISGAEPAESNTTNNQSLIQVQVAEANGRVFLPVIRR